MSSFIKRSDLLLRISPKEMIPGKWNSTILRFSLPGIYILYNPFSSSEAKICKYGMLLLP